MNASMAGQRARIAERLDSLSIMASSDRNADKPFHNVRISEVFRLCGKEKISRGFGPLSRSYTDVR